MQEDKEKSLNYSSKKVEIIGIYYLYVVKVTYMQRPVSTLNQNLRIQLRENQILYVQYNIRLPAGQ